MKHDHYPTPRTLITVWLILMLATAATMVAGKVTQISSVGMVWMGFLMVITGLKATLILRYFLDLRSASAGWGKLFSALIIFILGIIYALYAVNAYST